MRITGGGRVGRQSRRLPPLDNLLAFEVAARRLSFTDAAGELCVTQSAVSQRIKALEAELGLALFERRAKGLALTAEGARIAQGVREGLDRIAATLGPLPMGAARPLVISVLPSFASRWLVPRLHRFAARFPDAPVEVRADNAAVDPRGGRVDVAIRFGRGDYPGLAADFLMADSVGPVCAPSLLARIGPIATLDDLARAPILHDSSTERDGSGSDWASWLTAVDPRGAPLPAAQRFTQADHLLDAAVSGLGVALARASLIGADLVEGRLVRLPLPETPTAYAYFLVSRGESDGDRRIVRLAGWLKEECSGSGHAKP